MGILDNFRSKPTDGSDSSSTNPDADTEQLADGEPRGESRNNASTFASLVRYFSPVNRARSNGHDIETDKSAPPATITRYWEDYFKGFPLTRAPLRIFDEAVAEPGYRIEATVKRETGETDDDGEPITETVTDEEMEQALREWAANAAYHAAESDQDLADLIRGNPSKRRGKGTLFMEVVRAESGMPVGLMYHDPATFKIYTREDQAILVQPDDDVGEDHPRDDTRTEEHPNGKAAAYVQYDDDLDGYDDEEPVAFAAEDIIKFAYEPDTGDPWGTSIYASSAERIDALKQKLRDREASIRLVGGPLRVYSSEDWTPDQAAEWAEKHEEGELTSRANERQKRRLQYGPRNGSLSDTYSHGTLNQDVYDPADNPLSRATEYIGGDLDIDVIQGEVADIGDAVMDDVQMIFADMPVSQFRIAYVSDINQFVVQPQESDDARRVDQERNYLRRKIEPVFEEVSDYLAGGDEYEGDVRWAIESPPSSNPLEREDFPKENLEALSGAIKELNQAGADPALINGVLSNAGVDIEEYRENYEATFEPEDLAPELEDETPPEQPPENEPPPDESE